MNSRKKENSDMKQQPVSKYLGYSGGKGYVWVAFILTIMITFIITYYLKYHAPDYARWSVENPEADKIIWQTERGINPDLNQ
jgi:L-asparagine transporter-like permease